MHRNTASRSFPVLFAIFLAACTESTLGSSDKPPTVSITSPLNDAAFDAIEPLSFCAQIEDEDDLGALQIVVQSNLAGTLWQTGDSEPLECAGGNFGISLALTAESQTLGISVAD